MLRAADHQDRFAVTNSLSVEYADIPGTDGNDTLEGTESDDALNGGAGNDTLNGNGGNDRLTGGSGMDSLNGGAGIDVADYAIEGGTLGVVVNLAQIGDGVSHTVPSGPNAGEIVLPGEAIDSFGNRDTMAKIADIEDVLTGNFADVIYGNGGGNRLESGGGNDFVYGLAGDDVLIGGAGDDQLDGGIGDDTMIGGLGNDTYYVTSLGDVVTEAAGEGNRDLIFVTTAAVATYSLAGLPEIEQLIGVGLIDNVLTGNALDNVIDGGPGADAMAGGAGNDTYVVDNASDTVIEAAAEGAADEVRTSFGTFTLDANIERLTFVGTGASSLRGNAGDNVITGAAGNDFISLRDGGVDAAIGGTGNDVFLFGATLTSADSASGGTGYDQIAIQGNYGALTLAAGVTSIESIGILPSSDARFGDQSGTPFIYNLTVSNENLDAGVTMTVDANRLQAGEHFTFNGIAETDGQFFVWGGRGNDSLTGGSRNDVFYFGENGQFGAGDVVNGGVGGLDQLGLRGDYVISFGAGQMTSIESIGLLSAFDARFGALGLDFDYNLTMHDGNLVAGVQMTVDGATLRTSEVLEFNGAAELDGTFRVVGGAAADTIIGGQNAAGDILIGRGGADTLTGNGGNDTFRYDALGDSAAGSGDTILDFTLGDILDLGRIDAISGTPGNDAFTFVGENAFSNVAGQLRAVNSAGGNWTIEADVDGNGVADFVLNVTVSDGHLITAADFVL